MWGRITGRAKASRCESNIHIYIYIYIRRDNERDKQHAFISHSCIHWSSYKLPLMGWRGIAKGMHGWIGRSIDGSMGHWWMDGFIHSPNPSPIHPLIIDPFIHPFIHPYIQLSMPSSIHPFTHSSIHSSSIGSFINWSIHSSVDPLIHSYIQLSMHALLSQFCRQRAAAWFKSASSWKQQVVLLDGVPRWTFPIRTP